MQVELKTTEQASSAFNRALQRRPDLAPTDASFATFMAWRGRVAPTLISSVATLDDLRGEHETMCDLMGWPLGFPGLPPSTRAPIAKPVAPPDKPKTKVKTYATPWPPLPLPAHAKRPKGPMTAQESASAFLDWMRARGATGCFTSSELGTHYRIFTKAMDGRPAAGDHMRHELKRLSGVIKSQDDRRNEQLGGRRSRHTVWELRAAPALRRAA